LKETLLDRNENRYGPSPGCIQVLRDLDPEFLFNYSRDFRQGHYSPLSPRLAGLHGVDEKRIILSYGCEDLIKEAVHHVLRKGDRILVPSASWWYYRAVADEVEGETVEYPLAETPTAYVYDMERLAALRGGAKMLLIASPNNPTGNIFPRERITGVMETFRDIPVILDQAYFGLADHEDDDYAHLTERYPNLLVLRTFSKLYALAGARIGYGIAGAGYDRFIKYCSRNLGYNRVSERLGLAALDSPDYYEEIRRRMSEDRALYYAYFRSLDGFRVYQSQANFVLIRFPRSVGPGLKRALADRGLVIKFFDEPAFLDCARISLGTSEENARLIRAFQEILPGIPTAAGAK